MGLENALTEVTLVLFTTLAPSGIIACLILGAALLSPRIDGKHREALNKFLAIPVLVALVGLVASATHLGNPSNALYVLAGVGRSPLSNEVLSGGVFFGLVGSYWFYSFTQTRRPALERAWVALYMLAGLVFLCGIALAYKVDTIITWDTPLVPLNLLLNALVGGPLLALCALAAAKASCGRHDSTAAELRAARILLVVSALALAANTGGYLAQNAVASPMNNAIVTFEQLVPAHLAGIAAFAALCAIGIAIDVPVLRRGQTPAILQASAATVMALAGIFVMRFMFYMSHMTVGVAY